MAQIDAEKLLSLLTTEDVRNILLSLGATIHHENEKEICVNTICHNLPGGKYKLYYWKEIKMFSCYTGCSCSFNLFKLIQKRKELLDGDSSFPYALEYCCEICKIPYEKTQRYTKERIYTPDWKKAISKYLRNRSTYGSLEIYDKNILNFFPKIYRKEWLDFGISEEVLEMYDIRYYPLNDQVVIPCFSPEGELIGIRVRNFRPELMEYAKYIPLTLTNKKCFKFSTNMALYGINFNEQAIVRTKTVKLVEGEKSVLKGATWWGENNNTVGMYGSNLGAWRRNYLLKLGVECVQIITDKDFKEIGDKEYIKWKNKIQKQIDLWKGFARVEIIWDCLGILDYKENAFDRDIEVWNKLYEEREVVI